MPTCVSKPQTSWNSSSASIKKTAVKRQGYLPPDSCLKRNNGTFDGTYGQKESRNPCKSKDFGPWSIADSKRRTHLPPHPNQYHMVSHWNQNQHLQLNKSHEIPLRCGYDCGYASWCRCKVSHPLCENPPFCIWHIYQKLSSLFLQLLRNTSLDSSRNLVQSQFKVCPKLVQSCPCFIH